MEPKTFATSHINTLKCQQIVASSNPKVEDRETRQRQLPMPLPRPILRCRGNYVVAGEPSRKKMHRMQHHMGNKNDKEGALRQRTNFVEPAQPQRLKPHWAW